MKPGVLLANFGGPTGDDELVPFLRNLLGDVLPGPSWLSRALANRLAPRRAARVREAYRSIGWSPLVSETNDQAEALRRALGPDAPPVATGMMFTEPSMATALRVLAEAGIDQLLVVGMYPHWSFATSGSAYDMVHQALATSPLAGVPVHYARPLYDHPSYARAVANTVEHATATLGGEGPIHLLFSAHGIPVSFVKRGDPYPDHVRQSVRDVVDALDWTDPYHLSWQSRLGPVRWLAPDTPTAIDRLASEGATRLIIVPVSFVGEHIETLDELDREYVPHARTAGISHVGRAPALGLEPAFIDTLAGVVTDSLARFGSYACSRCLLPKPESHRRQGTCPNCAFTFPAHLREGSAGVG